MSGGEIVQHFENGAEELTEPGIYGVQYSAVSCEVDEVADDKLSWHVPKYHASFAEAKCWPSISRSGACAMKKQRKLLHSTRGRSRRV